MKSAGGNAFDFGEKSDLFDRFNEIHPNSGSVVENCASSAKVVGSIPREHTYWQYKCIAWMDCMSLKRLLNENGLL